MTHVWTLGTALMSKDNAAMTGARSRVAHTIVRGGRKAHATRMSSVLRPAVESLPRSDVALRYWFPARAAGTRSKNKIRIFADEKYPNVGIRSLSIQNALKYASDPTN